jgi:nucleotide-binding universal stress UspA family protein
MDTPGRQILVAVDGSQPSMWAVDTAVSLATRIDAAIVILHVIVPPTVGASEIALMTEDIVEGLKAEGEAVLEAAKRRLPTAVESRTVLREGYPAQVILAEARDTGTEFVVMGSRGRGRWAHFILGSIAEAVIREAPCPVVSVSHDPGGLIDRTRATEPAVQQQGSTPQASP